MKTATENAIFKKLLEEARSRKYLRRKPIPEAELPPEAQELGRKFREWHESFATPAKRMAFIKTMCQRIADAYQPEKIILFGSHAYGTPTPQSDVDLLIVMDYEGRPVQQMLKIETELEIDTPVDLLVYRPQEIKQRVADGDMFLKDVLQRGKVMYEPHHT